VVKKNNNVPRKSIDCACVLHGTKYDWTYVDRLYNMLGKNLSLPVNLHVWTEYHREVPEHMIKHTLDDWPGISGPKKSWWYKMQMFNPEYFNGDLLYFDLDIVIVRKIDWILSLDTEYFYGIKDFKRLQNPFYESINSSVMWFNTDKFSWIWDRFSQHNIRAIVNRYHGDQDYLNDIIPKAQRQYFDLDLIKSWRWQCYDGGMNFTKKTHYRPGVGTEIDDKTAILVFHGNPKPHEISDPVIQNLWQ
jgi:hypothetical protein